MNKNEFVEQMLGDFTPSQRYVDLHKRLEVYYQQVLNETDARTEWREFKRWCDDRGYMREEINRAKRSLVRNTEIGNRGDE